MFALQRRLLEEWVADQVESIARIASPRRTGDCSTSRGISTGRDRFDLAVRRDRAHSAGPVCRHRRRHQHRLGSLVELIRAERPGALRFLPAMAERPRYINLVVLKWHRLQAAATVLLVAFPVGRPRARVGLVAAADHDDRQLVVIGVARELGPAERLHHRPGVSRSAACAISVLLAPITRLLILLGNAVTPVAVSATDRSPPRSSCARSSTWPGSAGSWPTRNAG